MVQQSLRVLGVAVLACAGAVVILACLVALNFEFSGFGREADTPVQVPYVVALYAVGLAAVIVPVVAAWFLLGPRARGVVAVTGGLALLVTIWVLGLGTFW